MSVYIASCAVLTVVFLAHGLIAQGASRFYQQRIDTLVFDNPKPWYVRYFEWVEDHRKRKDQT